MVLQKFKYFYRIYKFFYIFNNFNKTFALFIFSPFYTNFIFSINFLDFYRCNITFHNKNNFAYNTSMNKKLIITFYVIVVLALFLGACVCLLNVLYPQKYKDYIFKYANQNNLSPSFVASVINAESRFNPEAKSDAGAIGLMQLMPETANWLSEEELTEKELTTPETNIKLGCLYLSKLINQFKNIECALAAYNAGPTKVEEWLRNKEYSSDGKVLTKIPFKETEKYVQKVKSNMNIYNFLFK